MRIDSLRFEHAAFSYQEEGAAVFTDVTLDLPLGRTTLVSGGARQGRSTVLRVLAGLSLLTEGAYLVNGSDVTNMSFEEFLPIRKQIGFSFDFNGLLASRTIWQNLMLPLEYHRTRSPRDASLFIERICRDFGLWELRDRHPAAVPGGARKACTVARAFVMEPEMALLDDPFVALDDVAAHALIAYVREGRAAGRLRHVFFTCQDEKWASRIGCDALIDVESQRVQNRLAA